jgi:hypothetical protein
MPKLSDETLFARALPLAIQDRIALSQSYARGSEHATNALLEAKAMSALKGKKLADLSEEEQGVAFNALVCAELWEDGLADANAAADRRVARDCARAARLYREMRLRRWGQTRIEQMMANSSPVAVRELEQMPLEQFQSRFRIPTK